MATHYQHLFFPRSSWNAPEKRGEYNIPVEDVIKALEGLRDRLAHVSKEAWFDPAKFVLIATKVATMTDKTRLSGSSFIMPDTIKN